MGTTNLDVFVDLFADVIRRVAFDLLSCGEFAFQIGRQFSHGCPEKQQQEIYWQTHRCESIFNH